MTAPRQKRFERDFQPIYNGIASADIPQQVRERVAGWVGQKLLDDRRLSGDQHKLFVLLASDPLVPCAGFGDEPCPEERVIRVGMHLDFDPFNPEDEAGRSQAWKAERPTIRCVSCGAKEFVPGHRVLT